MTAAPPTTCYRHPDRETGRRCTRCGRPACPACLREAPVGAHCVECVHAAQPSTRERFLGRWHGDHILVTKTIIAINVAVFVLMTMSDKGHIGPGTWAAKLAVFGPAVHNGEWWRLFTNSVVHYGAFHILFNMLVLWQVGLLLEPGAGKLRFALLYVVSVLGGAAGALWLSPHVYTGGASGGVVGLAAATTLVMQRQGVRFWDTGFGPLLVFVIVAEPFLFGNVSQGGHIGGLIAGLAAAELMIQARRARQPWLGIVGAVGVGIVSVMIAFAVSGR